MAATILVADALYRVSTLLQDINPQFTRWKERELVIWLNDAQRAIAKYVPFASIRVDSIKLAAGSRQSIASILAASLIPSDGSAAANVRGILLSDIIRNMGTNGATPGTPIRIIPREVQDNIDPTWHVTTGTGFVDHFMYDPRTPKNFYVVPAVSPTVATWVETAYSSEPLDLPIPATDAATLYTPGAVNAATLISIEDIYIDDIVNYTCAHAYLKDAEYADNQALAQMFAGMFTSSLNAYVAAITGQNPNISFLPFSPTLLGAAH